MLPSITRMTAGIAVLTIVLCVTACTSDQTKESAIRIGACGPFSGEDADYGHSMKKGIDLAIAEINQSSGPEAAFQVIYEDDRMTAREGVSAVRKLATIDRVPLILGPFGSSVVLAAAPVAEENHVLLLSASATADAIADAGEYIFRIAPPNSRQGDDIAEFSYSDLHAKTAAIIFQNNDYGTSLRDAFEKRFVTLGGKITSSQGIDDGSTEFRTQITKVAAVAPDVVFFPMHYSESGLFLKQAQELGLKTKFISADGAMTGDMLNLAGSAADGTYYTSLALGYGVAEKEIQQFETSFESRYGEKPDTYAAYYYDATKLVASAIRAVGTSAQDIKAYFYGLGKTNQYTGITGPTSFDQDGEVDKSFSVFVVSGGAFQLVD